jgi:hypothetical protein
MTQNNGNVNRNLVAGVTVNHVFYDSVGSSPTVSTFFNLPIGRQVKN